MIPDRRQSKLSKSFDTRQDAAMDLSSDSLRSRPHSEGPAAETDRLASAGSPRAVKLAAIRAQIESGTYETPERLEAALDRFLAGVGDPS